MKKINVKRWLKSTLAIVSVLALASTMPLSVSATENVVPVAVETPMIVLDKYEITNEKIVPGEDFTLTLTLSNYNQTATAKDVLIDIDNPDGVAPVYGTVSQVYVGDIEAGETKEVSIDYNSWTTIIGDTLDFHVTVVTDVNQNYIVLRVPVGSDSPFSILSTNVPQTVEANSILSVSLAFQVLGEENVRDVALIISCNGEKIADSVIGIVTPGVTKTQQVSTFFTESGEYMLDIGLEYVDNAGQKQVVSVGTAIVTVEEENAPVDDMLMGQETPENNNDVNNLLLMGVGGILILAIFLIVVIITRKNK